MLKGISEDVFAETWIVVPNHSAKQWLQKSLAKDLGVCSQIKFIMPLSFNWEVLKNGSNNEHDVNVFSNDVLRWQVFESIQNNPKYNHLKQSSDIEDFNLSERISQTLLKYNDEHPDIVAKWDASIYKTSKTSDLEWQIELWFDLLKNLQTESPVELLQKFNGKQDFKQTPVQIIFFATEQLTTLQKNTVLKLSQSHEIQLLISNPCPQDYWFDIKPAATKARQALFNPQAVDVIDVGNPILANLGYNKMALFDALLSHEIYLQDSDTLLEGGTLLQSLKQDIYTLQEQPSAVNVDTSVAIHSCHTTKREIEIIKDEVLNSLDNDKGLKPEDIIVVAPDINEYVQSIKESFSYDGNANTQYIPFHIDRVQLSDSPYVAALMKLVTSFSEEMTAPVIYELLTQNIILEKFKLLESDLPRLKNWMIDSNIRNYYSAQQKSKKGYEHKIGNTWEFGKNRWLTGYLTAEEDDTEYLSTYGDISGQEDAFSNCFEFLKLWFKYQEKAQLKRSPQQWYKFIQELCHNFLYNDFSDDYESKILKQLETKFIKQTLQTQQDIALVVIQNIIEAVITDNAFRSEGQIGIRFQTWENAFIIDAKLLIILGLNDNEFPKKEIKNDLNMFSKTPARLNKSTRQRDKNLMLTALTENTEKLIMTYIGFNPKTNDKQPPSVLLAEIVSYLEQKTNGKFKVRSHKMHGYNQCYFDSEHNSYSLQNFELAKNFYDKKSIGSQEDVAINLEVDKEVNLNDLVGFFVDPLQYFLKNKVNINYSIYEDNLQDTETYSPTGLEGWKLEQEIFTHGQSIAVKTGIVSDNKSGRTIISKYVDELDYITKLKNNIKLEKYYIEKPIAEYKVTGAVDSDDKQQLVSIYPNKVKPKSICQHWIKHLCYNSSQSSLAYFQDKTIEFAPIENNDELLLEIINKWKDSFSKPWLFCPSALLKALASRIAIKNNKDYLASFVESKNIFPSEGQKYFAKEVKELDEQVDGTNFLQPLADCLVITKV